MSSFVFDTEDVHAICQEAAEALELPKSFYQLEKGDAEGKDIYYFRINGVTFAQISGSSRNRRLRFWERDIPFDDVKDSFSIKRTEGSDGLMKTNLIYISLGMDCPSCKLYWVVYRAMQKTAQSSGDDRDKFGCCSRYVECSDQYHCLQPDRADKYNCIYKTNLDNGRIFYGINKTI